MREEIVVAIVMFAVSILGSVFTKNDRKAAVLFMFIASVAGSLTASMGIRFREIVEGPFGMLDSALSVICASVFVWLMYESGSFDIMFKTVSNIRNKTVKAFAVLLLVALPAALTGFATSSVLTTGKIVGENLKKNGVENKKVTAIVAGGAFIGMIMPPNCIPAMVAANAAGSVLPTPYVGFFLPLLLTAVPSYIVFTLIQRKSLYLAGTQDVQSCDSLKKWQKFGLGLVFGAVIALILVEGLLSSYVYVGGNTLIFAAASVLVLVCCKGFGSFKSGLDKVSRGIEVSVTPIALMLIIGSFVEVSSMTGVRGLYSLKILPYDVPDVMLVLIAVTLVLGVVIGEPIPAFIITYAVYPISWLANTVVVTGCAAALCCVTALNTRNGLIADVSKALGTDSKYKEVIGALAPVLAITVAIGIFWVYQGDNLSCLIL